MTSSREPHAANADRQTPADTGLRAQAGGVDPAAAPESAAIALDERRYAKDVDLAEVLVALDNAIEADWREEYRRRERIWHYDGRDDVVVSADSVAFELGLWEANSSESEWCGECRHMTHQGHWFRAVPWGEMLSISRKLGQLVKAGYVQRDPKYGSLYSLTIEGQSLVDEARTATLERLREAL